MMRARKRLHGMEAQRKLKAANTAVLTMGHDMDGSGIELGYRAADARFPEPGPAKVARVGTRIAHVPAAAHHSTVRSG